MGPSTRVSEMSRNRSSLKDGTGLCVPQTPTFRDWLESAVLKYRIKPCGAEGKAEAYLTQAAQSREYPVPLVAGEGALLRVFVMSEQETGTMIPPVRATFFVDAAEIHAVDIPAGSSAIPTEVQEGEFDLSANVEIPAEVIQPGPGDGRRGRLRSALELEPLVVAEEAEPGAPQLWIPRGREPVR